MSCCDDPTEPAKADLRDVARVQTQYGNLVRDLFTDDPEKVILKQLQEANTYLRELAALNAHYPSVRRHAIELLDKKSQSVLEQILVKEADSEFGQLARKQLEHIQNDGGLLAKLFHG
ncbi:MAG: hypothetical protein CVV13_05720 [Gammaproteobacteria bacterium HGW-Gammaproteobacteria-3]|nr:MAG: hypothetical protein CVV13_05720 [Gammaproteobacteria bacterium HGW-Gammaproteobacteria-3]